jgi:hypothetical protein
MNLDLSRVEFIKAVVKRIPEVFYITLWMKYIPWFNTSDAFA